MRYIRSHALFFGGLFFWGTESMAMAGTLVTSRALGVRVTRPREWRLERGTLIIANHQSYLDPFIVAAHLGFFNVIRLLPIRYPTMAEMMSRKVLGTFIRLLGAYSLGSSYIDRAKKLLFTRELLNRGYTTLLFPEGKIVHKGEMLAEFKQGMYLLFKEDCPVVFVRLSGFNTLKDTWLRRLFGVARVPLSVSYSRPVVGNAEQKIAAMESFFNFSD